MSYDPIPKTEPCTDCEGEGVHKCPECGGSGEVRCHGCAGDGKVWSRERGDYKDCPWCHGTRVDVCPECNGIETLTLCQTCKGEGEIPISTEVI